LRFFIPCTQHELNKQQCHTISSPFDWRHSASSPDEAPATDAHIQLIPLPLLLLEPLPLLLLELAGLVLEWSNQLLSLGDRSLAVTGAMQAAAVTGVDLSPYFLAVAQVADRHLDDRATD